jgi:hypothetical protein
MEHNNVMGIHKPMPGEQGIVPYSSYGSPKRAIKLKDDQRWSRTIQKKKMAF